DVGGLYEAAAESIADIAPWMEWSHAAYSFTDAEAWVNAQPAMRKAGDMPLIVCDASEATVLGSAGVNAVDSLHMRCNLGYWIRTSASGRGLAVRAARLSAIYAFEEMRLVRAEIVIDIENRRSVRVAEKLGATYEGVARHRLFHHGAPHDAHVFSLTRDDLPGLLADRRSA
ncbi:MAG: GNAT family N-acetyltransferase, partial [Acidimicrobiia bacterium]